MLGAMKRIAPWALAAYALFGPAAAHAKPDPMSAGSLERVEVHAMAGALRVTLAKTQHVRLDGRERDATRVGKTLVVRRVLGDVALTVPPRVTLVLKAAAGDVEVTGEVGDLRLEVASGDARLDVGLTEGSVVDADAQAGGLTVVVRGKTPFTLDAQAARGQVAGGGLSTAGAKAKVKLRSAAGDITVTRAE